MLTRVKGAVLGEDTIKYFATVADAQASNSLQVGDVIQIGERADALFDVIAATTNNGYDIIDGTAASVSLQLRVSSVVDPMALGAKGDGVTDDRDIIAQADTLGKVLIAKPHSIQSDLTFTNMPIYKGGYTKPSATTVDIDFPQNAIDELDIRWFGAIPDASTTAEVTSGTDSYIPIQSALFTAARTNGKITVIGGGGDYRCDTGLVNFIPGVGTCSVIGKGLLGFKIRTDADITMWHLGGSAQTIKRLYVVFGNPSAALTNQIGYRFASDDFQWSQSVIEQCWVENPHRGFTQNNQPGTFGTVFLNSYRNLQSINNRDWGFYFDSKNGSTTLSFDTCYIKGSGSSAKGLYIRNVKEFITSNFAFDLCVNNIVDAANVNLINMKNTALESNSHTSGSAVMLNLNATKVIVDGITDLGTTTNLTGNARMIFIGANASAGGIVKGYMESGAIISSGTKYRVAIGSAVNVEVDCSIAETELFDNGFHAQWVICGRRISTTDSAPAYANTFPRGEIVYKLGVSAGGRAAFIKTDAASPGTWKECLDIQP